MRIFVAGATGTLGRPVVRMLVARGHEVVGLTRTARGARQIEAMGARAAVGNALDAGHLKALVAGAKPDVVVHLLTALPAAGVMLKRQLRPTNQLRTTGTSNLIAAARAAGARRIVAESFVGVYGTNSFSSPVHEDDPLPPQPNGPTRETVLALRSLEDQLQAATSPGLETVALRIGYLYGSAVPHLRFMIDQMRRGRMRVPTGATGLGPFVHNDDAAGAIVAAIEQPRVSSVYNIVDDEPVPMADFLTRLSSVMSMPAPKTIPGWLFKLVAPVLAAMSSVELRLDNSKARRELGWTLRYPTIASGFEEVRAHLHENGRSTVAA